VSVDRDRSITELRVKAADLRAYGATDPAQTCERNARDLEDSFRAWWLADLTVADAAKESGYSEERLREMARDGALPHKKGQGQRGDVTVCPLRSPTSPQARGLDSHLVRSKAPEETPEAHLAEACLRHQYGAIRTISLTAAVRRAIQSAPCSTRALASEAGITHSTLVRIGDGSREATPAVAEAVARALRTWGARCTGLAVVVETAAKGD